MSITILGIESSCDDTSASVLRDGVIHSNIIATQTVHMAYGGVVPELASRAHQQNIIPVVDQALKEANVTADEIDAVAFTRGPGLLGSLMVGTSFAKGFALSKNIPLIEVNHLKAHILAHFIDDLKNTYDHPGFPFLALLVSGGNSQIIIVKDHMEMEVIGETIDDAAGEAFDKCAKVMGIPYPGGPVIDKRAKEGNPLAFEFSRPKIQGLNYSFSGLKTSFLYFIRDKVKVNPNFIEENMNDLCASLQYTIVDVLMNKVKRAVRETGIKEVAIAGGVSANSGLQNAMKETASKQGWKVYIPQLGYSLDNAAMVAITGYFKYLNKDFVEQDTAPFARMTIK
ncbi:N6-L-threonylcarbamoyladenine synthase [Ancylomarina subtilis]|uniref:tRNA N6-adenosine threonylcarbamoyltransferase n=1 Tax=Ancylomarina subtilis TaxID=1639035 RepID=A0A4Q7VC07_9BACT|nr:tRNA (adenosine(37)-N6)-threonylcarbamoyltransferase complex transferase subunit TsaD [Ancylomarina subtilis]RZT93394.1 N6-L-threonylcarbamoyladenine synthase [Ancylomarina subtilis]